MKLAIKLCLIAFQMVLMGLVSAAQAQQTFEEVTCPLPVLLARQEGVICGTVMMPESRRLDRGRQIRLFIIIMQATDKLHDDPVVFLQGGPGGAANFLLSLLADSPMRESRDIILVDQRGTGFSRPKLDCPELFEMSELLAAIRACRERLGTRGIDVSAYNSAENAADIIALADAIGYQEVNLYGVSYGTRLALTAMRDAPETIRSVVLDSSYPPQVDRMVELAGNGYRAMSEVFSHCRLSDACNSSYPDLDMLLEDTLSDYNSSPISLPFSDVELSGREFANLYFQALYSSDALPFIPFSINKLAEGEFDLALLAVSGLFDEEQLRDGRINFVEILRAIVDLFDFLFWGDVQSEGVYFSTECQEDIPFQSMKEIKKRNEKRSSAFEQAFLTDINDIFEVCKIWNVPPAAALEDSPISSSIPTLVLAGNFDPITPPRWSQLAASTLSNSFYVVFPAVGHGVIATSDCADSVIQQFLDKPEVRPDSSCTEALSLEFFIP